jgi:hypothetical protein
MAGPSRPVIEYFRHPGVEGHYTFANQRSDHNQPHSRGLEGGALHAWADQQCDADREQQCRCPQIHGHDSALVSMYRIRERG